MRRQAWWIPALFFCALLGGMTIASASRLTPGPDFGDDPPTSTGFQRIWGFLSQGT